MKGRLTLLAALTTWLIVVAQADASRAPTRAERAAISRVARGTPHAGSGRVHVSHIRVSTAGPWASATVALYFNGQPDLATDILHKVHHRWLITKHSPGTDGEWCGIGMPRADRLSLGFPACTAVRAEINPAGADSST